MEPSKPDEILEQNAIIERLPKAKGFGATSKDLFNYQNFWNEPHMIRRIMSAQQKFQFDYDANTVISTFPKSGSAWIASLSYAIVTRNRTHNSILSKYPLTLIPTIEMFKDEIPPIDDEDRTPLTRTHFHFSALPKCVRDDTSFKIVYMYRDPKDVFISFWFHLTSFLFKDCDPNVLSLEEAFEMFCNGVYVTGPWWDHVLGYWKASLEQPGKILFLKYEDFKTNPELNLVTLAEFMGFGFTTEEVQNGVVESIIKMCSFDNIKNLEVNKCGSIQVEGLEIPHTVHFRKGTTGDSKNHLTTEMVERLDSLVEQKLSGSGFKL